MLRVRVKYSDHKGNLMDTNQPPANETPPQPAERPPFNEVSVLFPLLTIYMAG